MVFGIFGTIVKYEFEMRQWLLVGEGLHHGSANINYPSLKLSLFSFIITFLYPLRLIVFDHLRELSARLFQSRYTVRFRARYKVQARVRANEST